MTETDTPRVISARSARNAAKFFNYGNIIAVLIPIPFVALWFGASMLFYALNRHHPNLKVGHYTQQAAYRFYALTGFLVAVGTFFPVDIRYYLAFWALSAVIIIPWSIIDLRRINRDTWEDIVLPAEPQEHPHG
ncbi:MAG: hypothetical protein D6717_10100 [Gammaproteobacteria bacterium]|nr:MAG: hypothetical protein D6717_10100 [Gammaproteobacteria bacterium]